MAATKADSTVAIEEIEKINGSFNVMGPFPLLVTLPDIRATNHNSFID